MALPYVALFRYAAVLLECVQLGFVAVLASAIGDQSVMYVVI